MKNPIIGTWLPLVQLLYASRAWAAENPASEDVPTWPAIIILLVLAVGVLVLNWHNIRLKKPDRDKDRKHAQH